VEDFRKKNQAEILEIKSSLNQIKNTVESYSSRLDKVKDRILGLKDKIYINEKTGVLRQKTQGRRLSKMEIFDIPIAQQQLNYPEKRSEDPKGHPQVP
jgi:DNA integrity scanning protein DisA with diadenylate cyclase activity